MHAPTGQALRHGDRTEQRELEFWNRTLCAEYRSSRGCAEKPRRADNPTMEIRELAAGVLCVGVKGITFQSGGAAELSSFPVGGVILRPQNVVDLRQTRELVDAIRSLYAGKPGPIVAIDHEGGRISPFREGVAELPPMMALGATDDTSLARRAGKETGNDLRRAGVNFTFGPVLDLALFRNNTVIGARSFGSDPMRIARVAGAFANGLRESGIVAAFKHFPGHGATASDSHLELPFVDAPVQTLRSRDLVPFAQLLPGAQAVSTAHIVLRAFDPDHPATTSSAVLQNLLRTELRFQGVCISDCIEMDAIVKTIGAGEAAVQAINAGVDLILVSRNLSVARDVAQAIARAVESGALPRARLEQAYARVRLLREKLAEPVAIDAPRPDANIGNEIALRAITVLRGPKTLDPARHVVVSFEGTILARGNIGLISKYYSLTENHRMPEIKVPLEPGADNLTGALTAIKQTGRTPIVLMRRAHIYAKQAAAIRAILEAHPDAVLVSLLEPYDALMFAQAQTVLCAYGDERPCIQGLAAVLFDGTAPRGTLPIGDAA